MMKIIGPAQVHGPQSLGAPHRTAASQPGSVSSFDTTDELSLSPEAQLTSQALSAPDIRADKVASIRAQIESGAYETPEKLDVALERLLDEIG